MIEILILSLVQGFTEFLPVSSSAHLILISKYLNFQNHNLSLDISLHIGSFLAVIVYFAEDILNFIKNKKLFFRIIFSSFPVMVVGYFLIKFELVEYLRNIKVIGWTTIIFGMLLYIGDKFQVDKKNIRDFSLKSAIFIGLAQVFSLVPGVSRSGITITAARMLKFKRYDSAKISFLLSIPTLGVITLFGLKNLFNTGNLDFSFLDILSVVLSFFFSYITIKYFLKYIQKFSLTIFVIYRIILGLIILFMAYL